MEVEIYKIEISLVPKEIVPKNKTIKLEKNMHTSECLASGHEFYLYAAGEKEALRKAAAVKTACEEQDV